MTIVENKMAQWKMLTVVGKDQPGIVAMVTGALYDVGANIGETSMMRLGCQFTMMMMVGGGLNKSAIIDVLEDVVGELDLKIHVEKIEGELHKHIDSNISVTVHGADKPGIVAKVSQALFEAGASILELDSTVGGTKEKPLYIMLIQARSDVDAQALQAAIDERQLGVSVTVNDMDVMQG